MCVHECSTHFELLLFCAVADYMFAVCDLLVSTRFIVSPIELNIVLCISTCYDCLCELFSCARQCS